MLIEKEPKVVFSLKLKSGKNFNEDVVSAVSRYCVKNIENFKSGSNRASIEEIKERLQRSPGE